MKNNWLDENSEQIGYRDVECCLKHGIFALFGGVKI